MYRVIRRPFIVFVNIAYAHMRQQINQEMNKMIVIERCFSC
jgi:hypothetical protein